jgi:hypothetical protein
MPRKPGLCQHLRSIAAHRYGTVSLEKMMIIETIGMRVLRHRAEVPGNLPIVFTAVLEVELKGPDRE